MSDGIDERVDKLEGSAQDVRDRLTRIEVKLEHCATREDVALMRSEVALIRTEVALQGAKMQEAMGVLTWRIIGLVTGVSTALVAATYFLARSVS